MIYRRWSLRTRIVLFSMACLIPVALLMGYLLDAAAERDADRLIAGQRDTANLISASFTSYLNGNVAALTKLTETETIVQRDPVNIDYALGQAVLVRPELGVLFVINETLQVVNTAEQPVKALLAKHKDQFVRSMSIRSPLISGPVLWSDGAEVFIISVPIVTSNNTAGTGVQNPAMDEDVSSSGPVSNETTTDDLNPPGRPIGVILSVVRVDILQQFVFSGVSGNTSAGFFQNGQLVIATDATWQNQADFLANRREDIANAEAGETGSFSSDSRKQIGVYQSVAVLDTPWSIVVSNRHNPVWWDIGYQGWLAIVAASLLIGALALAFGELTARPIRVLRTKAVALSQGQVVPVEPVGEGEVRSLSVAMGDLSARIQTQFDGLVASQTERGRQAEQMRDLLRRTLRLQEDERRRIAGDIHDAVSPLITGALYQARALQRNDHDVSIDERQESLADVNELLERASVELHEVIFDLRPPDLDDIGVVAAIEAFVGTIQRTGLRCQLEVINEPPPLSPEVRLGIYRIVQEALHNVVRHASADEAIVRIEHIGNALRVSIRDNGSGFDPETAVRPNSLGLLSMRERALAIGATLTVNSRIGGGTLVLVERPNTEDVMSYDVLQHLSQPTKPSNGNGRSGRSGADITDHHSGGHIW